MNTKVTYDEIVASVKNKLVSEEPLNCKNHISIHINITDLGNQPFYVEVAEGKIHVEPYGYFNSDAIVNVDSKTILEMTNKEISFKDAYNYQRLGLYGDFHKIAELRDIVNQIM